MSDRKNNLSSTEQVPGPVILALGFRLYLWRKWLPRCSLLPSLAFWGLTGPARVPGRVQAYLSALTWPRQTWFDEGDRETAAVEKTASLSTKFVRGTSEFPIPSHTTRKIREDGSLHRVMKAPEIIRAKVGQSNSQPLVVSLVPNFSFPQLGKRGGVKVASGPEVLSHPARQETGNQIAVPPKATTRTIPGLPGGPAAPAAFGPHPGEHRILPSRMAPLLMSLTTTRGRCSQPRPFPGLIPGPALAGSWLPQSRVSLPRSQANVTLPSEIVPSALPQGEQTLGLAKGSAGFISRQGSPGRLTTIGTVNLAREQWKRLPLASPGLLEVEYTVLPKGSLTEPVVPGHVAVQRGRPLELPDTSLTRESAGLPSRQGVSGVVKIVEELVKREVTTAMKQHLQTMPTSLADPARRQDALSVKDLVSNDIARQLLRKLEALGQEERFRLGRLR